MAHQGTSYSLMIALYLEGLIFRRSYVQKLLCSENICSESSMFRWSFIRKVLCLEGPIFRRSCIQKIFVHEPKFRYLEAPSSCICVLLLLLLFCNWLIFKFFYNNIWPHFCIKIVIYWASFCVIIALCHALWFASRPSLHCVFVSCLVPLIYLCPRERLALRLDLRRPLLLLHSPFLVQLLFAFCSSFRALRLFLWRCLYGFSFFNKGHSEHMSFWIIRDSEHMTLWT